MTKKTAIYSLGNAHEWLEVAKNLRRDLSWEPAYWVTVDRNHEEVGEQFPDAVRHNFVDLNRCIPAQPFAEQQWSGLDSAVLDEFRNEEQLALELMDRMDLGGAFTHWERQRTYLWHLAYWLNVIDTINPHVMVFNAPPHSPGELVLHSVCRKRGVNLRVFLPTQIGSVHLVSDGYDRLPARLEQNYAKRLEAGNLEVSPTIRQSIDKIIADDGTKQWYVVDTQSREEKKRGFKEKIRSAQARGKMLDEPLDLNPAAKDKKWFSRPSKPIDSDRLEKRSKPIRRVYKRPGQPLSSAVLTRGEYRNYLRWAYAKKVHLEQVYTEYSKQCDVNVPFVFLALHYQPERTTCPDGGRFNNQFLAASLIAHALPDGWQLYVKEHPGQYTYHNNGEQSRNPRNLSRFGQSSSYFTCAYGTADR